jgi:hypothetical protein
MTAEQPKTRIFLIGAGSNGKDTLKNDLLVHLAPLGWKGRESSASSKKVKMGINMKEPIPHEQKLFQSLSMPWQVFEDMTDTDEHSVSNRSAIDFLGFTGTTTPELYEHQFEILQAARNMGLYARDLLYYLPMLERFTDADNRFSDRSIYEKTDAKIREILELQNIKHFEIPLRTSPDERVEIVLADLRTIGFQAVQKYLVK